MFVTNGAFQLQKTHKDLSAGCKGTSLLSGRSFPTCCLPIGSCGTETQGALAGTKREGCKTLHHSAVVKAFSEDKDREVLLFVTWRFAQICQKEHPAIMADETLVRLCNGHEAVICWLFQQVQEAEKEQGQMETDLARKVAGGDETGTSRIPAEKTSGAAGQPGVEES
jgi:hypothetical protein